MSPSQKCVCFLLLWLKMMVCPAVAQDKGRRSLLIAPSDLLEYLHNNKNIDDGDLLTLEKGEFQLDAALSIRASNVTINGAGIGSEISCLGSSSALIIGAPGLIIKNVTFKNCRARSAIQLLNARRLHLLVDAVFENVRFIDNSIIEDPEHGGAAVFIGEGCSLAVRDSLFKGNHAQFGGALYVSFMGHALVENSAFEDNSALYFGGGAIFSSGNIRIVNTKFVNCTSVAVYDDPSATGPLGRPLEPFQWLNFPEPGASGGAIVIRDGPVTKIANSFFTGNSAAAGGAISATYRPFTSNFIETIFEVSESSFSNNSAVSNSQWAQDAIYQGGAIHLSAFRADLALKIAGSNFQYNSASFGGALHIVTPHTTSLEISGCNFKRNRAKGAGGAVVLRNVGSTTWIANSVVGNMAGLGGGVFLTNNAHLLGFGQARDDDGSQLSGKPLLFENNTAIDGGAIGCLYCGSTVLQDPIIRGNMASRHGGGVSVENALSEFFLQQLVAKGNQALKGGALYVNSAASFGVSSATFGGSDFLSILESNQATSGGGLYLSAGHRQSNKVMVSRTQFDDNSAVLEVELDEDRVRELYDLVGKPVPVRENIPSNDCGVGGGGGMCLILESLPPDTSSADVSLIDLKFSRNMAAIGGGLCLSMGRHWDDDDCQDHPSIFNRECNRIKLVNSSFVDNIASDKDPGLSVDLPDSLMVACSLQAKGSSLRDVLLVPNRDCLVMEGNTVLD